LYYLLDKLEIPFEIETIYIQKHFTFIKISQFSFPPFLAKMQTILSLYKGTTDDS
jgi:hypothetical protein